MARRANSSSGVSSCGPTAPSTCLWALSAALAATGAASARWRRTGKRAEDRQSARTFTGVSEETSAAIVCAADASYKDVESLPTYRVQKLYYMVDSENFISLVAPYMEDMSFPVDDQLRGEVAWKEWMITTRIDMADYCQIAWRAVQCHQSQLPSLGALAEMHDVAARAVLAMQGTFYRAFSLVNGERELETDLFEGI